MSWKNIMSAANGKSEEEELVEILAEKIVDLPRERLLDFITGKMTHAEMAERADAEGIPVPPEISSMKELFTWHQKGDAVYILNEEGSNEYYIRVQGRQYYKETDKVPLEVRESHIARLIADFLNKEGVV